MLISISLNNSTVLVLVNGKKFELTRTRTRNSNSTWLETLHWLLIECTAFVEQRQNGRN